MKKLQPKPQLYGYYFVLLQEKARELGYNLLLHGSLHRDCDMVAIAWSDTAEPTLKLIQELDFILTGKRNAIKEEYLFNVLPGRRLAYVIDINRGDFDSPDDPEYYLDISVLNFSEITY